MATSCWQSDRSPLTCSSSCSISATDADIDVRKIVVTNLANPAPKRMIYTPPDGEHVLRDKLANLEKFIYGPNDLDPLVRLAVSHYQFEAIHPFSDGNGRTGRIINILYLLDRDLLGTPVLYLRSRYIIENKDGYYRGAEKGHGDRFMGVLGFFICWKAVEETARWTRGRVLGIKELMNKTTEIVKKAVARKIYSKDLIEVVFHQPYSKIKFLEEIGDRQPADRVATYLRELEKIVRASRCQKRPGNLLSEQASSWI